MRIERAELRQVELPLVFPFETSFGREETKSCVLVRLYAGGLEGWGEAPAAGAPLYNEETVGTAWHILEEFILPLLLGRDLSDPREFPPLVRHLRRHHMAKAGVEAALWDLFCQAQRISLAQALGGTRRAVDVGVSLGIEPDVEPLRRRIEEFLGRGYRRIKVKIKPGWDVTVVRRIRDRFGGIRLQVDANSAYTLAQAPLLRELDDFDLLLIEQPLGEDDIVDHAALQAQLRTPICLDESIVTPDDARKALDLGSCRVINIKAARLSGLPAGPHTPHPPRLALRPSRRLPARRRHQGLAALAHGNRGRPSPRRLSAEVRARVLTLARTRYAGVNDHHLTELLAEREGLRLSRRTVHRFLRAAGIGSPPTRRPPRPPPRRAAQPPAGPPQWGRDDHGAGPAGAGVHG